MSEKGIGFSALGTPDDPARCKPTGRQQKQVIKIGKRSHINVCSRRPTNITIDRQVPPPISSDSTFKCFVLFPSPVAKPSQAKRASRFPPPSHYCTGERTLLGLIDHGDS